MVRKSGASGAGMGAGAGGVAMPPMSQLMKMKREVLRVGGYEREYFISQTPDLVDDADGVIDVVALALQ